MVIEYVARGDLLGFLRKTRGLVDTIYIVPDNIPQSNLSQCQLLKMACNVASGMAHLSQNHVSIQLLAYFASVINNFAPFGKSTHRNLEAINSRIYISVSSD